MTDDTTSAKPPEIRFMGKTFPYVPINEFTIDENLVLWHWAQMGPDQVGLLEGVHVGVIAAMIEVSVCRADLRANQRQLRERIGKMTRAEIEEALADFPSVDEEDESADPLSAPVGATGNDANTKPSGPVSSLTGEKPLAVIEGSGSGPGGSDVSSGSDPVTSATGTAQVAG